MPAGLVRRPDPGPCVAGVPPDEADPLHKPSSKAVSGVTLAGAGHGHYDGMNPQYRPGDRVRIRMERGTELIGTVVTYLSGDLFIVEVEQDGITLPRTVRAGDMRRIEDAEDEG